MTRVQSFAPLIGIAPRLLILGSMPGVASLEAVQYYAHPRNAFWPIMGALFGFDPAQEYAARVREIESRPLILWDTLQACHRPGSLDARIDSASVLANDFDGLLTNHSGVRAVFFNGATSEKYFRRLVLPNLDGADALHFQGLPSTSPAHAGMGFDAKLAAWRRLLDFL